MTDGGMPLVLEKTEFGNLQKLKLMVFVGEFAIQRTQCQLEVKIFPLKDENCPSRHW